MAFQPFFKAFLPDLKAGDNSLDAIGDLVRVGWP